VHPLDFHSLLIKHLKPIEPYLVFFGLIAIRPRGGQIFNALLKRRVIFGEGIVRTKSLLF
jgi:hypothetical protein